MRELPSGTVTLLFTDVEGSTQLLHSLGDGYGAVLALHRHLLRQAFGAYRGQEVDTQGDSFLVAFAKPADAVAAAAGAQRSLATQPWAENVAVRVRMGLHTGEPTRSAEGYVGLDVHLGARLMAAGHGGQVLMSQRTTQMVQEALPPALAVRDLGSHRLKDLRHPEQIYQLLIGDLPDQFPPLRSLNQPLNNLPGQLTRLIGRDELVATGCKMLSRQDLRLLTLTGPGGTGKTRLSLALAEAMLGGFADGAVFVELAAVTDASALAAAVGTAIGIRDSGTQPPMKLLAAQLRDRQLLLVLDNFEQLIEAGPAIGELLSACPKLKAIVSSRIALHIRGEQELPVPPLELPQRNMPSDAIKGYPAVQLFVERAQAVNPNFCLTAENAALIGEICTRLDGLPLALELAAARARMLSLAAMLERLDNRLKLLTGGGRDLNPRQQTLRGTIAWSYELLRPDERQLFRRLAVFSGGCTIAAVESVCAFDAAVDGLELLGALVDKSLLRRQEHEAGEPRFSMLATIQDYALEQLIETNEAPYGRRRHAKFFEALAADGAAQLDGPRGGEWIRRLDDEIDNLRQAINWAEENDAVLAATINLNLWGFWDRTCRFAEALRIGERLLSASSLGARPQLLADVGRWVASLVTARNLGNAARARALLEASLAIYQEAGQQEQIAETLFALAKVANILGDDALQWSSINRCLEIARTSGRKLLLAGALDASGMWLCDAGNEAEAEFRHKTSLLLCRELDNVLGMGWALQHLGLLQMSQNHLEAARASLSESLEMHRQAGCGQGIATCLRGLFDAAEKAGDHARAYSYATELRVYVRSLDDQEEAATGLNVLAHLAARQGDLVQANSLFEEDLAIAHECGSEGLRAWSLRGLGAVALEMHDIAAAQTATEASLEVARSGQDHLAIVQALLSLAHVAQRSGHPARAKSYCQQAAAAVEAIDGHYWRQVLTTSLLEALACNAASEQLWTLAALTLGATAARPDKDLNLSQFWRADVAQAVQGAKAALGEMEFEAVWHAGGTTDAGALLRQLLTR